MFLLVISDPPNMRALARVMEQSRQLAKMLQTDPSMVDVRSSVKPKQKNLVCSRGGSDRNSKVSAILSITANVNAAGVEHMISDVFSSLSEAPANGPVRSSVFTHPVFESNRGQPLVQLRRRHIFDPSNQVGSL